MKHFLTTALLCASTFTAWIFWPAVQPQSVASESGPHPAIEIAEIEATRVSRSDLSLWAEATGHLQAWRQTEISVERGGTILWRGAEEGHRAAAGDILLRLDDRDVRIELAEAEADLLKVQAQYSVIESLHGETIPARVPKNIDDRAAEYELARKLFAEGVISEQSLVEARRRYDTARMLSGEHRTAVRAASTGLTQAEQRLERARLALERTRLLAPFAGRVADVEVEVGQQVAAGRRCLVLLDESRVKVDVQVLEADVPWLRAGAPARVRVPALDRLVKGRIHTINPRVSEDSGTARVTVVVDNPDGALIPGLFAFVELQTRRLDDRVLVPAAAVLLRQDRELVFRVEDGRAHWTYVRTGARSAGLVEIEEGLEEGDLVATAHHFALAHEAPVRIAAETDNGGTL